LPPYRTLLWLTPFETAVEMCPEGLLLSGMFAHTNQFIKGFQAKKYGLCPALSWSWQVKK